MAVHREQPAVGGVFWCGGIEARNGPEGQGTSLRSS